MNMIAERRPWYKPMQIDYSAAIVRGKVARFEQDKKLVVTGLEDIGKVMKTNPNRRTVDANGNTIDFRLGYSDSIIIQTFTKAESQQEGKPYGKSTDIWYIYFTKEGALKSVEQIGDGEIKSEEIVGAWSTQEKLQRFIDAFKDSVDYQIQYI